MACRGMTCCSRAAGRGEVFLPLAGADPSYNPFVCRIRDELITGGGLQAYSSVRPSENGKPLGLHACGPRLTR